MTTSVHERPGGLWLRGARLFDGERLWPGAPCVWVDGEQIVAVGEGTAPDGVEVLDFPGATLLPGLVDTHVHLCFDASPDPVATLRNRDDAATQQAMGEAARIALRGGVTTVRDLGDRNYLSLGLRNRPGLPTIVAAGPPITTPLGHCHFLGGETADSREAIVQAVRDRYAAGCDVIKVMSSGGSITPGTRQEDAQFARDVLSAAVQEAHRLGLAVVAHAHATSAIENCLAARVDGMEHVTFWSADGVDDRPDLRQAIADSGIVVGATAGMLPLRAGMTPPPGVLARIPKFLENHADLVRRGSVVVVGTDAGIGPLKPHDILRTAVGQLGQFGLTPIQALHAVTVRSAVAVGLGRRKGRLAPGYDADLLIVDGDPFTDAAAIHHIRAVFSRGQRVVLDAGSVPSVTP